MNSESMVKQYFDGYALYILHVSLMFKYFNNYIERKHYVLSHNLLTFSPV